MTAATDESKQARTSDGATDTFERFFRAEYRRLVQALTATAGSAVEAEDLVQEAMARAYERWDRIGRLRSPAAYVYVSAVNIRRGRLRRLSTYSRRIAQRAKPIDADGLLGQERVEQRSALFPAIRSLPSGQRDALFLVDWLDAPVDDAAALLDIAPASVRSRVHRAHKTLIEILEEQA